MLGRYTEKGDTDRALNALNHPIRRRLLFELLEEADGSAGEPPRIDPFEDVTRGATRIELVHVHLPKLAERGYVDWERDENTVTTGENWDAIEPLLDLIYRHLQDLPPRLRGTRSPS